MSKADEKRYKELVELIGVLKRMLKSIQKKEQFEMLYDCEVFSITFEDFEILKKNKSRTFEMHYENKGESLQRRLELPFSHIVTDKFILLMYHYRMEFEIVMILTMLEDVAEMYASMLEPLKIPEDISVIDWGKLLNEQ